MGTLIGHVGPGFGFLLIGLWHLYNHLKLLAQRDRDRDRDRGGSAYSYKSEPWFPCYNNRTGLVRHLELYLIITGCTLSVAMELFIGPEKHQPFDTDGTIPSNHLHNFEHSSISLTFLVYAVFALALDKCSIPNPTHFPAQHDVLQFIGALAFAQQLLMFHLHSTDHMGVEGQYHWLLQLVVFVSLATTLLGLGRGDACFIVAYVRSLSIMFQGMWLMVMGFALWTPGLIAKGCFMHVEEGHMVVRCDGEESLHRAKGLVNIQFSWLLIFLAIFAACFYVLMMKTYGNSEAEYSAMSSFTRHEDEYEYEYEDEEAQRMNKNLVQTQSLVSNKVFHHMET